MRTWVDNTGIQSAGNFFSDHPQRTEDDLKNLLQLANLMIFSEGILYNDFEPEQVREKTNSAVGEIFKDLDKNIIFPVQDRIQYFDSAIQTGEECSSEIQHIDYSIDNNNLRPHSMPSTIVNEECLFVDSLRKGPVKLFDDGEDYKQQGSAKIIHYLFSTNEKLRNSLREIGNPDTISKGALQNIYFYLRSSMNQNLAYNNNAIYVPSSGRQLLIRQRMQDSVVDKINEIVPNFYLSLPMPSVQAYLINKAKGDPRKLIEFALITRDKAGPLRKHITLLLKKFNGESDESYSKITSALKKISEAFLYEINGNQPKLVSTFDLMINLNSVLLINPMPTLFIKISEFQKWINHRKMIKKISLLTEISRANENYNEKLFQMNYNKLLNYR
jgi:hypothetical protein